MTQAAYRSLPREASGFLLHQNCISEGSSRPLEAREGSIRPSPPTAEGLSPNGLGRLWLHLGDPEHIQAQQSGSATPQHTKRLQEEALPLNPRDVLLAFISREGLPGKNTARPCVLPNPIKNRRLVTAAKSEYAASSCSPFQSFSTRLPCLISEINISHSDGSSICTAERTKAPIAGSLLGCAHFFFLS